MKLEHQVCSLDLAKRLKELGVKQESLWYWAEGDMGGMSVETEGRNRWKRERFQYSAFTVAEMGEILPWNYHLPHKRLIAIGEYPSTLKNAELWEVKCHGEVINAPTEADARAKMLIYLIEQDLVKP